MNRPAAATESCTVFLKFFFFVFTVCATAGSGIAQDRSKSGSGQSGALPSSSDPQGVRELTPEEIPPNLNYYTMDPLYDPNAFLGRAKTRIEEKIGRGVVALNSGAGYIIREEKPNGSLTKQKRYATPDDQEENMTFPLLEGYPPTHSLSLTFMTTTPPQDRRSIAYFSFWTGLVNAPMF